MLAASEKSIVLCKASISQRLPKSGPDVYIQLAFLHEDTSLWSSNLFTKVHAVECARQHAQL